MSATPCVDARNNRTAIENHLPENLNRWNTKTQDFQHFFLNVQIIWKLITWNDGPENNENHLLLLSLALS